MPEFDLEWSSPAGPSGLAYLAGPWRRVERSPAADGRLELFRARPGAAPALAQPRDPRPILADAATRLRELLGRPGAPSTHLETLRARLQASPDMPLDLLDLWRRGTAPARVETLVNARPALVTDLGPSASLVTRRLADVPSSALELHRGAVAAALRTRIDLLHTARSTLDLAATIVALVGAAAAVMAVPLAWRFLHDLLAEHAASQGH